VAAAAGVLLGELVWGSCWVDTGRIQGLQRPILDGPDNPCTTSYCLLASLAAPDSDGVSLDGVLAAKCAEVSGVLCDFHLLHLLSEGGTISEW
jgi:hypothetical protein